MKKLVLVLLTTLILGGCGGGGGGGGNDISASYKGSTTQATVTASNAKVLSVNAVQGVEITSSVGALGKSVTDTPYISPEVQSIANILENSISRVHPKSTIAKTVANTAQGTQNGYTGSFSYTIDVNQSTGGFTGTISFNQYSEYSNSGTLSGNISFSGVYNQTSDTFTSLNITVTSLQGEQGTKSFTLIGSMSLSSTTSSRNLTMSIVLIDNVNNRTNWLKDFSLTITGNTMTISGTYYDHVHGYVVMSTVTPLSVPSYSSQPTSGQILFTGSNGTKARLTYTDTGYTVEVDANGNNNYVLVP